VLRLDGHAQNIPRFSLDTISVSLSNPVK